MGQLKNIKIRMLKTVRTEWFGPPGTILRRGEIYNAESNPNGAISGICGNGERLGVKPGEFEFIEAPESLLKKWKENIDMPNWCEGTLKIRGKNKDIINFMLNGIQPVDGFGGEKENLNPQIDNDECFALWSEETCHIPHTYRGFIRKPCVEIEGDGEDTSVVTFDTKFAWNINAEELLQTCLEYNFDMKIYAFERGMRFNRDIEIVDGQITQNDVIHFKDYDWECICPDLGG